jgi:hypothetical protein
VFAADLSLLFLVHLMPFQIPHTCKLSTQYRYAGANNYDAEATVLAITAMLQSYARGTEH